MKNNAIFFVGIVAVTALLYGFLLLLRGAFQDVSPEEYRVYSDWYTRVRDEIDLDTSGQSRLHIGFMIAVLDSSAEIKSRYPESIIKELEDKCGIKLDMSIFADFYRKNSKKHRFNQFFNLGFPCTLLTRSTIDTINDCEYWKERNSVKLFQGQQNQPKCGYALFKQLYKDCENYRLLSRVGFDERKKTALLWQGIFGWDIHSDTELVLFEKKYGKWVEKCRLDNRIY